MLDAKDARSHNNSSLNAVKDPFLPRKHTRRSISSPQEAEHVMRGPSLCLKGDRHPAHTWRFSNSCQDAGTVTTAWLKQWLWLHWVAARLDRL